MPTNAPSTSRQVPQTQQIQTPPFLLRRFDSLSFTVNLSAQQWRSMIGQSPIVRSCIQTLIMQLTATPWRIEAKSEAIREYYTAALEHCGDDSFNTMVSRVVKDILEVPFGGAMEVMRYGDNTFYSLRHVDAGTMAPTYNEDVPFIQVSPWTALDRVYWDKNEILRVMWAPRSDLQNYGWSITPCMDALPAISALVRSDKFYNSLMSDTPPAGILDLMDMSKEEAEDWISGFRLLFQGMDPLKVPVLYDHSEPAKWLSFNQTPTEMQLPEIIRRYAEQVTSCFGMNISDLGIFSDKNMTRAAGESQRSASKHQGLGYLMQNIRHAFNAMVLPDDVSFEWDSIDDTDRLLKYQSQKARVDVLNVVHQMGAMTSVEVQAQLVADDVISVEVQPPKANILPSTDADIPTDGTYEPPAPPTPFAPAVPGAPGQDQNGKPTGNDQPGKKGDGGLPGQEEHVEENKPTDTEAASKQKQVSSGKQTGSNTPKKATKKSLDWWCDGCGEQHSALEPCGPTVKAVTKGLPDPVKARHAAKLTNVFLRGFKKAKSRLTLKMVENYVEAIWEESSPFVKQKSLVSKDVGQANQAVSNLRSQSKAIQQAAANAHTGPANPTWYLNNPVMLNEDQETTQEDILDAMDLLRDAGLPVTAQSVNDLLNSDQWYEVGEEMGLVSAVLLPIYAEGLSQAAQNAGDAAFASGEADARGYEQVQRAVQAKLGPNVTVETAFNVTDPKVLKLLDRRAAESVKNVDEGTKRMIRSAIVDGVQQGRSVYGSKDSISQAIYDAITGSGGVFSKTRAQSIALTEVNQVQSSAHLEQMSRMGLKTKGWLSVPGQACTLCNDNASMGWVPLEFIYDSVFGGTSGPPGHPRVCRCFIGLNQDEVKDLGASIDFWLGGPDQYASLDNGGDDNEEG